MLFSCSRGEQCFFRGCRELELAGAQRWIGAWPRTLCILMDFLGWFIKHSLEPGKCVDSGFLFLKSAHFVQYPS